MKLRRRPPAMMLRMMRHCSETPETIDQFHAWVARYRDGHEEILLTILGGKIRLGPATHRRPLEGHESEVWDALNARGGDKPVSIALRSFCAVSPFIRNDPEAPP